MSGLPDYVVRFKDCPTNFAKGVKIDDGTVHVNFAPPVAIIDRNDRLDVADRRIFLGGFGICIERRTCSLCGPFGHLPIFSESKIFRQRIISYVRVGSIWVAHSFRCPSAIIEVLL